MSSSSQDQPPEDRRVPGVDRKSGGLFRRFRKPAPPPGEAGADAGRQAEAPAVAARPKRLTRLRSRLARTRKGLIGGLGNLFLGKKVIDDEVLEELETRLLLADVGVEATGAIISNLTARVSRRQLADVGALLVALQEEMLAILGPCSQPLRIGQEHHPFVILMIGVNGVGKTTTIGKLARRLQAEGKTVMLAAGDTFRAAAVEQLQIWGERNRIPVIAQAGGADPAAVIYDAIQSARARRIDVLIADTAGRLHTQSNLIEELKKIKRVIAKLDPAAPHEVMLVVDAGTGQNALSQAVQFDAAVGVSGIALTKLDGTARGGVIFAIAKRLGAPIRFIGVGEDIDDLREFDAGQFITALLSQDEGDGE